MQRWFKDVTLNMSMRIIVGKRDDSLEWKKPLNDFFEVIGKFVVSDVPPFLGWHKRKIDEDEANSEQDLMGVLLAILRNVEEHDADTINKADTLALILAAEDTTSITMTWALSLLLNNRDALHKVQHELNIHVGKDRLLVKESDTKNLVYLGSVIKETLRLYPVAPLSLVHEAIEDCTVDGYQVSAGTLFSSLHTLPHQHPIQNHYP
ncbi:Cytochrome P450 [Hibiscus syriacus]|uniref:Cytochrome P450 n=1 Tax=Hibiscus syriacus TaxID=106335 RepID=A0A6A2YB60_HIBSY|nr:Cytochrome P450 [Hibiscus syriacus]